MGAIFSISRIWDAISDPIAGYLSDRTTFKFEETNLDVDSFVPIAFGFLAVFPPGLCKVVPRSLDDDSNSKFLLCNNPFQCSSWPWEQIIEDYHERTRLFGVRHMTLP